MLNDWHACSAGREEAASPDAAWSSGQICNDDADTNGCSMTMPTMYVRVPYCEAQADLPDDKRYMKVCAATQAALGASMHPDCGMQKLTATAV